MKMSMEFGAMVRMEEKPRIWGETAPVQLRPLENLAPNKIRSNPGISDERPATNRLIHGMGLKTEGRER
jgi:hypothetical protein